MPIKIFCRFPHLNSIPYIFFEIANSFTHHTNEQMNHQTKEKAKNTSYKRKKEHINPILRGCTQSKKYSEDHRKIYQPRKHHSKAFNLKAYSGAKTQLNKQPNKKRRPQSCSKVLGSPQGCSKNTSGNNPWYLPALFAREMYEPRNGRKNVTHHGVILS